MSWTGFGDLDLSGVEADAGSARLPEGTYNLRVVEAKVDGKQGSKDRKVILDMVDEDGHGDIRVNFNVFHSNEQAMDIGRRQLKGFLEAAKHPNPDKPGDIKTLVGLRCVGIVGMGKPWKDSEGKSRQNTEVKKFMPAGSPAYGPAPVQSKPASAASGSAKHELDDEIPF